MVDVEGRLADVPPFVNTNTETDELNSPEFLLSLDSCHRGQRSKVFEHFGRRLSFPFRVLLPSA